MEALKTTLTIQVSARALLYVAFLIPPTRLSQTNLALAFLPPILACNIYTYSSGLGFLSITHSLWALELFFLNPREGFCIIRDAGPMMTMISADGKERKENMIVSKENPGRLIWREFYPELFWGG
ncbi:hypothetical protein BDZ45DRAFT_751591 [Acephala macrosclerotiorum]|nr:hypothetical protein BDZ45DRAFT_751591 [Acephala macrosclerotiorum]